MILYQKVAKEINDILFNKMNEKQSETFSHRILLEPTQNNRK